MKTIQRYARECSALFCALLITSLFIVPAIYGQSVAPVQTDPQAAPALSPETQNFVLNILTGLAVSHPWIATIIAGIGLMRVWAKPVFSAIHALVNLTPNTWDDGLWAKFYEFFTGTPVGKFLAYLLDWLGSVKIKAPVKLPVQEELPRE